jgi:hypothetical protein
MQQQLCTAGSSMFSLTINTVQLQQSSFTQNIRLQNYIGAMESYDLRYMGKQE